MVEGSSLAGLRILLTRTEEQAASTVRLLREHHAQPLVWSAISVQKIAISGTIDELSSYDWVLFTSANAVRFFEEALRSDARSFSSFRRARFGAIGKRTAQALEQLGKKVDLVAEQFVAESFVARILSVGRSGDRVLLPRARVAREVIPEALTAAGFLVQVLPIYETGPGDPPDALHALLAKGLDGACFSSSSTVTSFVDAGVTLSSSTVLASIGPVTAATMRAHHLPPTVVAEVHTMEALIDALERYFRGVSSSFVDTK